MAVPPPAPRARPAAAKRVRISSRSLPRAGRVHSSAGYAPHRAVPSPRPGRVQSPAGYAPHRAVPSLRPGRVRTLLRAWTAAPAAIPAGARAPGVSRARLSGGGARIGGRPAARCPSTEAHAPPIWKESVCLLHSILRQGPQSTAIRPLRRRTKHPRRVKNPDQPHDSRPRSITPPRAAAKKSDQPPPCRHPSVDVSAHPSPWRGDQAAGAIAGQAATIRAAALLTVSRPAGPARGGRNRRRACHMAGRGSAPRRQDGVPSAHREAVFSPRIAGGDASQGEVSPTRRWRGDQAAGASRGRRQPSGQRPR